jgi:dihydroorotase
MIRMQDKPKDDVLLYGARPIGFVKGPKEIETIEIATRNGIVVQVGESLDRCSYSTIIDARGKYVSPGWIDLHTHICDLSHIAVSPSDIGPINGVTTLVDAGSVGESVFEGFYKYIIKNSAFPIRAFLNIGSHSTADYNQANINMLETMHCVKRYPEAIVGIKIMASKRYIKDSGLNSLRAAKRLAVDLGLPVMVHVAEPPPFIEEVVDLLQAGDIVTHCYHGKVGNGVRFAVKRVLSSYRQAQEKGILLDVAHGESSFSLESARVALSYGIKPFSISTDLHAGNINGPVWSLATVMSKLLACGLSLDEVVRMVTANPATIVGSDDYGVLEEGVKPNITVFDIQEGCFMFSDAAAPNDMLSGNDQKFQETFSGKHMIVPEHSLIGNLYQKAAPRGIEENRCG